MSLPQISEALDKGLLNIAVASDHTTYSEIGQHGPEPVPILVFGKHSGADRVATFGEHSATLGSLGRFPLQQLVPRILDASLTSDAIVPAKPEGPESPAAELTRG